MIGMSGERRWDNGILGQKQGGRCTAVIIIVNRKERDPAAAPTSRQAVIKTRTKGILTSPLRRHDVRAFALSKATVAAGGEDNAIAALLWLLSWSWLLLRSKGDTLMLSLLADVRTSAIVLRMS